MAEKRGGTAMGGSRQFIHIDLSHVKLQMRLAGAPALLLYSMTADSVVATIDGRLEEAIEISDRLREHGKDRGLSEVNVVLASTCGVTPRLLLGRTEEAFDAALAHREALLAHLGRDAEAQEALDQWVVDRPGVWNF
jgi:hypothetical protein